MIDLLRQKILDLNSTEEKINKAREFLQVLILKIMFDKGCFNNLAFVGGTALRILYNMRRYSEDLDFCLIKHEGYDFKDFLQKIKNELIKYNFEVEFTCKDKNIVNSSFLRFNDLFNKLGLGQVKKQKLSIKLEIDTNPPENWKLELVPVTESFVFVVNSFDLSSLYATKLHACFFRKFTKGRDYYDLLWYLGKKIEPNYLLLNNAIKQTEKKDLNINKDNLKFFIKEKVKKVDFNFIKKDVERFLEDKNEIKLLDQNIMLRIL